MRVEMKDGKEDNSLITCTQCNILLLVSLFWQKKYLLHIFEYHNLDVWYILESSVATRVLPVYELLNCMPRFLANSFLGLSYVCSVQAWYICLNLIDLSKKSTFCLFKTEFKAKKTVC